MMAMLYLGLAIWQRYPIDTQMIMAMAGDDDGTLLADDGDYLEIM